MKTTWLDQLGPRGRKPGGIIVMASGEAYRFKRESIGGVCSVQIVGRTKNGKWSSTSYEVEHHSSTVFLPIRQDFETGEFWPQSSWEEGYMWLKTRAPALTKEGFESLIRSSWGGAAKAWDEKKAAQEEFGGDITPEQEELIRRGSEELSLIKTKTNEVQKLRNKLETENREIMGALRWRDEMIASLEEAEATIRALQGDRRSEFEGRRERLLNLIEEFNNDLREEVSRERENKELGNSLGAAFAAIGL